MTKLHFFSRHVLCVHRVGSRHGLTTDYDIRGREEGGWRGGGGGGGGGGGVLPTLCVTCSHTDILWQLMTAGNSTWLQMTNADNWISTTNIIQYVFKLTNFSLPRSASNQVPKKFAKHKNQSRSLLQWDDSFDQCNKWTLSWLVTWPNSPIRAGRRLIFSKPAHLRPNKSGILDGCCTAVL